MRISKTTLELAQLTFKCQATIGKIEIEDKNLDNTNLEQIVIFCNFN